jgi:putative addiction module component (TIGR02574 family)
MQASLMGSADLAKIALELPAEERLDLARRLVESVVAPASLNQAIAEGIRRIEDLATGRVHGLTEEEFRFALK